MDKQPFLGLQFWDELQGQDMQQEPKEKAPTSLQSLPTSEL